MSDDQTRDRRFDQLNAAGAKSAAFSAAVPGKPSGFRALLGYEVTAWREGYAEMALTLDTRHMNSIDIVHGGLYATLLDAACGHAATWCPVPGNTRVCVTISLTTSFLGAVSAGRIIARGHVESVSNRIAVCRAEVLDQDARVLAIGQGSFRYGTGSEHVAGVPRGTAAVRP